MPLETRIQKEANLTRWRKFLELKYGIGSISLISGLVFGMLPKSAPVYIET